MTGIKNKWSHIILLPQRKSEKKCTTPHQYLFVFSLLLLLLMMLDKYNNINPTKISCEWLYVTYRIHII